MAFACRESEGTAGKGHERDRPGNGYPVAGRIMGLHAATVEGSFL
jgi:hypothetical protein